MSNDASSDTPPQAGTNWLGWSQAIGTGLQSIGSIMAAKTAKDNYKLNAEAFKFNKEMQSATSLANIQNRIKQYQAVNPNADVGYLQSLAQRLQGYLPQQQNQAPAQLPLGASGSTPAAGQLLSGQQPMQQPPVRQQQGGYNTMSQYGQRG